MPKAQPAKFEGFSKQTLGFFKKLKKNNDVHWFAEHKSEYEQFVQTPSRLFVADLGDKIRSFAPDVVADPRVNKSLFRINRDVRFSKDKSPYKTHMGIWLWEGARHRMENSGFYFHLDPPNIMLGVGVYCFPKPLLEAYRDDVVHPKHGPALAKAIATMEKAGFSVGGKKYKRTPRGYDPDHKLADLLLYDGLYTGVEMPALPEFFTPKLIDFCAKQYKAMLPLHKWLKSFTERID